MIFANVVGVDRLSDVWFLLAYSVGSVVGSASYWTLVRACWMPNLTRRSVIRTVGLCLAATLVSLATERLIGSGGGDNNQLPFDLRTICWWVAFSLSLFVAERSPANSAMRPTPLAGSRRPPGARAAMTP